MKKGISVAFILLGVYWVISALSYGLWVRNGPGGGFLPLLAGILAIIFAALILRENIKNNLPANFNPKAMIPVAALLAIVVASKIIGLILAIAVYLFVWLKYYEKQSLRQSTLIAVICPLILYLVFVMWLKAPLPKGILGLL